MDLHELEELEARFAAAKKAGDMDTARTLVSQVNAARKEAADKEANRLADMASRGLNPDGSRMSPHEELLACIFGQ